MKYASITPLQLRCQHVSSVPFQELSVFDEYAIGYNNCNKQQGIEDAAQRFGAFLETRTELIWQ